MRACRALAFGAGVLNVGAEGQLLVGAVGVGLVIGGLVALPFIWSEVKLLVKL